MTESLPTRLLLMLARATPEKLAAVERFLAGEHLPDPQNTGQRATVPPGPAWAPAAAVAVAKTPSEPWDIRPALAEIHRQISAVAPLDAKIH